MDNLSKEADKALRYSHSPYSNFKVGAALLCGDGTVYTGTNIENASFSATVCAERVAFFKAVSEGKRDFKAIAVVNDVGTDCPPCGVCRQVMAEFCRKDFKIVLKNGTFTLEKLFPKGFSREEMC